MAAARLLLASVVAACGALAGCSGSGSAAAAKHDSRTAPSGSSSSGAAAPVGASTPATWTANLTWARGGLIQTGVPATPTNDANYVTNGWGLVAMAGTSVVTADYTPPDGHTATPVSLQFRDAATGSVVAVVKLRAWEFGGLRADTVNGKPVVEVHYAPMTDEPGGSTDGTSFISTVFDASGHQLWTSAGQTLSNYLKPGLLSASTGLVSGGYLLRFDPGSNDYHKNGGYTVQDLTGKTVMTVPYHPVYDTAWPMGSPVNGVQLIDGYAVITHADLPAKLPTAPQTTVPTTPTRFHFTVYDLGHGAKQVADVTESYQLVANNVHTTPSVVGSCGGKLLLEWNTGSMVTTGAMWMSVLDVGTGRTTAPVSFPAVLHYAGAILTPALTDHACSTALVSGTAGGYPIMVAVDLTRGTVLWHNASTDQTDHTDHAVSIRDGVIYVLRAQKVVAFGEPVPAPTLVTLSAADGSTRSDRPDAAPLGFTDDGSAIFATVSDPGKCSPPAADASGAPSSPSPGAGRYRGPGTTATPPADCGVVLWASRSQRRI